MATRNKIRSSKNEEVQSPIRRSRRLRGAEVEFTENTLEEFEKERRSRSRSATPNFDLPSNKKQLNSTASNIKQLDGQGRKRINFDESIVQEETFSDGETSSNIGREKRVVANKVGKSRDFSDEQQTVVIDDEEEKEQSPLEPDGEEEPFSEDEQNSNTKHSSKRQSFNKQPIDYKTIPGHGLSEHNNEDDETEEVEESLESEDKEIGDGSSASSYEEDIEDAETVQKKRNKLPKSVVDDQFFNLAEMNAFLDAHDKQEERKSRNLGQFDNADEMDQLIRSYEEENLKSRSWALSGEITAVERQKDELLEHYVEVDYRAAAPPTITAEKAHHLESIIAKRVKDNLFDDVVRKIRFNEALLPTYRNQTNVIEQNVRKSLAEVYGDKFADQLNTEENGSSTSHQEHSKLDPEVENIKRDLDTLFLQLDALSHFQFRPQPIHDEVKVVNNMSTLVMEEMGPSAAMEPEVALLAPEEVMRRVKTAPKADEERTATDRKRQRRRKKKKQRILASIGAMSDANKKEEADVKNRTLMKKKRRKKIDFAGLAHNLLQGGEEGGKPKHRRKSGKLLTE